MNFISSFLRNKWKRLYRHAFQCNPKACAWFSERDDLRYHRKYFLNYIKFYYSLIVFYSIVVVIPSLIYFFTRFSLLFQCDLISSIWLNCISAMKVIEIVLKSVIIFETIRINNRINESKRCARKFMELSQSNIFYYQEKLDYTLLFSYAAYFLFFRRTAPCQGALQFHVIINWLIIGYCFRIIISAANYLLSLSHRGTKSAVKLIKCVHLTRTNINEYIHMNDDSERDECSICIMPFVENEVVKILPCNRSHVFHKSCINKWFKHKKICPTCRIRLNNNNIK